MIWRARLIKAEWMMRTISIGLILGDSPWPRRADPSGSAARPAARLPRRLVAAIDRLAGQGVLDPPPLHHVQVGGIGPQHLEALLGVLHGTTNGIVVLAFAEQLWAK